MPLLKNILFCLLLTSTSVFSQEKVVNDSTIQAKFYKNQVGVKAFGPLFISHVSLFYVRNIVHKRNYYLNIAFDAIYSYKMWLNTNKFGASFSINNIIKRNKNGLLLGIGTWYLFSPEVNSGYKPIFTNAGFYEPRHQFAIFTRIGWQRKFSPHWGLQLAYMPYLTFNNIQQMKVYENEKLRYEWSVSGRVLGFEFSILYFF